MTKKIIIFFMLSCTYLMAADVQLDEESTRKAKCTMGFVAVIGCTAFEWLSQNRLHILKDLWCGFLGFLKIPLRFNFLHSTFF